jgi:hypothetical protein
VGFEMLIKALKIIGHVDLLISEDYRLLEETNIKYSYLSLNVGPE